MENKTESIFKDLESKLRLDNEFLNKKVQYIIETCDDQRLINELFDLTTLCNKYVEHILQKKERSSLLDDKLGDLWPEMCLYDLVKNQRDKEYYEKALIDLDSNLSILGKRLVRPGMVQPQGQEEEKKEDGDVRMRDLN